MCKSYVSFKEAIFNVTLFITKGIYFEILSLLFKFFVEVFCFPTLITLKELSTRPCLIKSFLGIDQVSNRRFRCSARVYVHVLKETGWSTN